MGGFNLLGGQMPTQLTYYLPPCSDIYTSGEGTYVNLLIRVIWRHVDCCVYIGAIVIQIKFDVIMDLLKRRKLKRFTPDD